MAVKTFSRAAGRPGEPWDHEAQKRALLHFADGDFLAIGKLVKHYGADIPAIAKVLGVSEYTAWALGSQEIAALATPPQRRAFENRLGFEVGELDRILGGTAGDGTE